MGNINESSNVQIGCDEWNLDYEFNMYSGGWQLSWNLQLWKWEGKGAIDWEEEGIFLFFFLDQREKRKNEHVNEKKLFFISILKYIV